MLFTEVNKALIRPLSNSVTSPSLPITKWLLFSQFFHPYLLSKLIILSPNSPNVWVRSSEYFYFMEVSSYHCLSISKMIDIYFYISLFYSCRLHNNISRFACLSLATVLYIWMNLTTSFLWCFPFLNFHNPCLSMSYSRKSVRIPSL